MYIASICFVSRKSDSSLFKYFLDRDVIYLLLYVDDIVLTTTSDHVVSCVISLLSTEFAMTEFGPLSFFLGVAVTRDLTRANMSTCNPWATHADMKSKLPSGTPVSDLTLYRCLAGAPRYLSTWRSLSGYLLCS